MLIYLYLDLHHCIYLCSVYMCLSVFMCVCVCVCVCVCGVVCVVCVRLGQCCGNARPVVLKRNPGYCSNDPSHALQTSWTVGLHCKKKKQARVTGVCVCVCVCVYVCVYVWGWREGGRWTP